MEEEPHDVVRPDEDLDLKAKEKRLGKFLSRWCVFSCALLFLLFPGSGCGDFPCGKPRGFAV
jgi:hypothetical protein